MLDKAVGVLRAVAAEPCGLAEPGAEDEPALQIAGDEPVVLERDGEAVGGGAGQPGGVNQSGQGLRPRLQSRKYECGLV